MPAICRNAALALSVVLLHAGFIHVLYSGLLIRAVELLVPTVMVSQLIELPAPKVSPPAKPPPLAALAPPPSPSQVKKTVPTVPAVVAPMPLAINDPMPAPNAPTGSATPQAAPAPAATLVAAAPATQPVPVAALSAVQLPASDADYLQNPRPAYPAMSRRLNEQGRTTVRVLIGIDGQPQRAEIGKSSGFSRLDDAAVATVMRWRYVPGKRGGVAEAMWFNVPINWVLE